VTKAQPAKPRLEKYLVRLSGSKGPGLDLEVEAGSHTAALELARPKLPARDAKRSWRWEWQGYTLVGRSGDAELIIRRPLR
jgi:hypothetical protein